MPFYSSDKNENIKDYDAINPIQDGPISYNDVTWHSYTLPKEASKNK